MAPLGRKQGPGGWGEGPPNHTHILMDPQGVKAVRPHFPSCGESWLYPCEPLFPALKQKVTNSCLVTSPL